MLSKKIFQNHKFLCIQSEKTLYQIENSESNYCQKKIVKYAGGSFKGRTSNSVILHKAQTFACHVR